MKKSLLFFCALLMLGVSGVWATPTDVTVIDKSKEATTYGSLSSSTFTTNAASGMAGVTVEGVNYAAKVNDSYGYCLGCTSVSSGTVTMTAPEGYVIMGYSLTGRLNTSNFVFTLTPSAGGNAVALTTGGQNVSAAGLEERTASFTYAVTANTTNPKVNVNTFYMPSLVITIGTEEEAAFAKSQLTAYNTAKGWISSIQTAEGLISNASNYSGNAIIASGDGGGLPALLDNNTSTFCHTAYSGSGVSDPGADHYIQAYINDGTDAFYLYTYKRTQNNNNRPTKIDITASNDGSSWTDITSLTSGLTTNENFLSSKITLGSTYKYIRFTVPTTNTGAKYGDHVFFTYSEFWLLPSNDHVDEAITFIKDLPGSASELTNEQITNINTLDLAIRTATIAPWKAAFIASAGESSNFGKVGWPSASAYTTFCNAVNALTVDDDYETEAATAMATLWGTVTYPATGYYYLHNKGTGRYAFSNEDVSTSQDYLNDESRTSKYIWKVTLDGSNVKIYSLTGHGITLNNNGGEQTGNIALETPDANNYAAARGAFYVGSIQDPNQASFTKDGTAYVSATNPMKLTYWNGSSGPNKGDRQGGKAYWIFEPIDVSTYDVYTVNFVDAPGDNYVTYTGAATTGNTKVWDGGQYFMTKDATVGVSDFTPETVSGYGADVTISSKTITITYTITDYEPLIAAYFDTEKQTNFANAGKIGYMQNTGDDFTNLKNLILTFMDPGHVYTESDYNNLITYYEACAANVKCPDTGNYLIKNYYTGTYLKATSTGFNVSAGWDANAVVRITNNGDGTYAFAFQGKYIGEPTLYSNLSQADAAYDYTYEASTVPGTACFNKDGENIYIWSAGGDVKAWTGNNSGSKWAIEEISYDLSITLNDGGDGNYYATFCAPFSYTVGSGATAYTLEASGEILTPTPIDGEVTAGTPVLLQGTSSTATLTIGSSYATSPVTGTALTGTYLAKEIDGDTDYVLGINGDKVGFYHWDRDNLAANRAYIDTPEGPVKGFVINWDNATGIKAMDNVQGKMDNAEIYNLAGQRMNRIQKGVNIVNGKKVLVK